MSTTYTGIDYGRGNANIDRETGIRYGVIAQNSVNHDAFEDVWQNARDLSYEHAVGEAKQAIGRIESVEDLASLLDDWTLDRKQDARELLEDTSGALLAFPLSPESVEAIWSDIEQDWNDSYAMNDCGERDWLYESHGYKLANCLQSDVMVLASPYFTYAQFCSPCVPGACNLDSPLVFADAERDMADCPRAYCLGHDYFDGGRAPYPVYSVATGQLVAPTEA